MDYIECSACKFRGEVHQLDRRCPKCKEYGTLQWTYSKCCSSKILSKNEVRYCSKCETNI